MENGGNTKEPGEAGGHPGESSLFSLTIVSLKKKAITLKSDYLELG